ncbi:cytochrome c oxidase subunit 1 [Lunasporangiospora selenospora]|uniref:Cytochrome c oxidase subunit 1 n=1 Tax=Lunasporangiospora selenospora TaxID=979761 RepID=A0A9P6G161_9FUNG|nr:cytochrome c oxidase subunit 1 [Lunasporangiospora selenospora]
MASAVRVTLKAPSDGIATPDYCTATSRKCLFWNENDILYEPGVDGALITTRAQITQYGPFDNQSHPTGDPQVQCDVNLPSATGCDPYRAPSTLLLPTSYVADIERFTLMFEHSIRGQATGVQMRSGNMDYGLLRDSTSGKVLRTFTNESRSTMAQDALQAAASSTNQSTAALPKGYRLAGDVMTVGEFLKAAGVDLDNLSESPTVKANETIRSSGVVVIVVIQYAAKGWNPNRISYEYLPKAIPDQEYKVIETIRDFRGGNRVEINRHGIRIVFSQAGQLGQFSFMTLLTNLVAAVALFKVANIVVELMMLRLHPQKKVYVRAKYENTRHSAPWKRDGEGMAPSEAHISEATIGAGVGEPGQGSMRTISSMGSGSLGELGGNKEKTTDKQSPEGTSGGPKGPTENELESEHGMTSWEDTDDDDDEEEETPMEDEEVMAKRGAFQDLKDGHNILAWKHQGSDSDTLQVSRARSSSKEPARRPHSPISRNGTSIKLQTLATKGSNTLANNIEQNKFGGASRRYHSEYSRNSISVPALKGAMTADDIEIETLFGPVRPNEFKGFNPGGIPLNSTPPLSPSVTQTRIVHNIMCGMATPERQTIEEHGSSTLTSAATAARHRANQSPAIMQAASPCPVFFGPDTPNQNGLAPVSGAGRRRQRRHANTKEGSQDGSRTNAVLTSRHSTSSISSLTSSSSSSSIASSCEASVDSAGDNRTVNTAMSLHLGSGVRSTSPWSFGMPDSPLRGYSSGCESVHGMSTCAIGGTGLPPPSTLVSSPSSGSRSGFKKRRKDDYSTSSATNTPAVDRRASEEIFRPNAMEDNKGKQISHIPLTPPWAGVNAGESSSSSSYSQTTQALDSAMAYNTPVLPFRLNAGLGPAKEHQRESTTAMSATLLGKQPVRSGHHHQGLRTSLSSPCLLGPSSSSSSSAPSSQPTQGESQGVAAETPLIATKASGMVTPSSSNMYSSPLLVSNSTRNGIGSEPSKLVTRSSQEGGRTVHERTLPPNLSRTSTNLPPSSTTDSLSMVQSGQKPPSRDISALYSRPSQTQLWRRQSEPLSTLFSLASGEASDGPSASVTNASPKSSISESVQTQDHRFSTSRSISESTSRPSILSASTSIATSMSSASHSSSPGSDLRSFMPLESAFSMDYSSTANTSTGARSEVGERVAQSPSTTAYPSTSIAMGGALPYRNSHGIPSSATVTTSTASTTNRLSTGTNSVSAATGSAAHGYNRSLHPASSSGASCGDVTSTAACTSVAPSVGTCTSTNTPSSHYNYNPSHIFFTSPVTMNCTTTLAGTGILVLGSTITMVTAGNKQLHLRRSEPLILDEGIGEEKAARM